eukprot:scaffold70375_cov102-Phaeocystis_antarctica.AAC.1
MVARFSPTRCRSSRSDARRARFDERLLVGESRAASVARLLAAQRDPAEWRPGTGREPSATVVSKASRQRR